MALQVSIPEGWTRAQFEWFSALGNATAPEVRQRLLRQHPAWSTREVVELLYPKLIPQTPHQARAWLPASRGLIVVADSLQDDRLSGFTRLQTAFLLAFGEAFQESDRLAEQARQYFERASERLGMARALHLQGENAFYTAGAQRTLELLQKALHLYEQVQAYPFLIHCEYGLVRAYHTLGRHELALQTVRRAETRARQRKETLLLARLLNAEGIVLRSLARYDEAINAYQQALTLWQTLGHDLERARTIANIGLVHWSMGLLSEARLYYAEAMQVFRSAGSRIDEATCLLNTALTHLHEENYASAIELLSNARQIFSALGDEEGEAYCLLNLADAENNLQRYDRALGLAHQACVKLIALNNPPILAQARLIKAHAQIGLRRTREADGTLRLARPLLEPLRNTSLLVECLFLQGESARVAKKPTAAEQFYENCIDYLENIISSVNIPPEEMGYYLHKWRGMVSHIAWFYAGRGRAERAYRACQVGKGVALRLALATSRSASVSLKRSDRQTLERLWAQWESANRRVQQARTPTERRSAQREADRRYIEWQRYQRQLALRTPQWGIRQNLILMPSQLPLEGGTLLIEYALAEDGIAILCVKREQGSIRLYPHQVNVPYETVKRTLVELQHALETSTNLDPIYPFCTQLYNWLLRPIESRLSGVRHLILCPDDVLHEVPWSALRDGQGRFLIERFSISTSSSATVWALAKRSQAQGKRLTSPRALMVAVSDFPQASQQGMRSTLSRLPGVAQERALFQRLFGARALLLSERSATRQSVLSALPRAEILHFATHAVVNRNLPMLSAFALHGKSAPSWLYARDILEQRLPARLTVLSACSTAQGVLTSDGMMGLAWAFLIAGCPTVVSTLWKLPDEAVPLWMESFYNAYLRGESVAQSVRMATLRLLRHPRCRHPRYWGAWIVQGAG